MNWDDLIVLAGALLIALLLGMAGGVGFGIAFNIAARPTFDRAEKFVDSLRGVGQ